MWLCDDPVGGLGKDLYGIVQRYFRGDLARFHIPVKHDTPFHDAPFWCLSDGMVNGTGRTHYRHMNMVCELESSFKDIWKYKIRYEFPNNGRAKKCVKI
ncbi:hypothetical protein NPIL_239931 [Nephila pilipes]|uniref:Uncharacterized protein n=1 Tax=Nephila pilipes TaxID=299642 RepID=A0A8X6NN04_NEPPI|nr:hypothetical protein NPIL_239931 [Nephila pilipes]